MNSHLDTNEMHNM